jgi:hypothetical protein
MQNEIRPIKASRGEELGFPMETLAGSSLFLEEYA